LAFDLSPHRIKKDKTHAGFAQVLSFVNAVDDALSFFKFSTGDLQYIRLNLKTQGKNEKSYPQPQ